MRKLALLLLAVSAVVVLAAMGRPPVEQLVEGQAKCGNDLCVGSAGTQLHVKGNAVFDRPILPGSTTLLIDGGVGIGGALNVTGALTTGSSTTSGVNSPAVIDAGTLLVRGDTQAVGALLVGGATTGVGTVAAQQLLTAAVVDAGTALFRGDVQFAGAIIPTSTTVIGDITLNAASPAVATATVRSGAKCVCTLVGTTAAIAAKGVACSVSSTTLTATSANAAAEHVQYICY